MYKVKKIMYACKGYIISGHLWLQYSKYGQKVDIRLHAQVWRQINKIWWSKMGIVTFLLANY